MISSASPTCRKCLFRVGWLHRPGDTMDLADAREDWWKRWGSITVGAGVGMCKAVFQVGGAHVVQATRKHKVLLVFALDKDSTTMGSVTEWKLKEAVCCVSFGCVSRL